MQFVKCLVDLLHSCLTKENVKEVETLQGDDQCVILYRLQCLVKIIHLKLNSLVCCLVVDVLCVSYGCLLKWKKTIYDWWINFSYIVWMRVNCKFFSLSSSLQLISVVNLMCKYHHDMICSTFRHRTSSLGMQYTVIDSHECPHFNLHHIMLYLHFETNISNCSLLCIMKIPIIWKRRWNEGEDL